ncbi:MAG: helix-turn-helix transcriptional regulator [Lachnospiraceae bacterium]|nr:helix-turn-helix transcriptional regulator [Lachnospiraceae bacterium]
MLLLSFSLLPQQTRHRVFHITHAVPYSAHPPRSRNADSWAPFISENYNTITEKDAADHCNLSYHHFSFAIKQLMGKNFSEYLTSIKIKEAEKMLLTTDHSITDIAYETGFSNVSHFISRFRQYKGITPAKFRKHVIIDNMR